MRLAKQKDIKYPNISKDNIKEMLLKERVIKFGLGFTTYLTAFLGYLGTTKNISFDISSGFNLSLFSQNAYWAVQGAVEEPVIALTFILLASTFGYTSWRRGVSRSFCDRYYKKFKKDSRFNLEKKESEK